MTTPCAGPRVAVVGGGIAGLAAAATLLDQGIEPTVFEAGDRAGGVVGTIRRDGFLAETGPHSMTAPPGPVLQLLDRLGLVDRCLPPRPAARNRFVVRGGRPVRLPGSPGELLSSDVLSPAAKLRILGEPFVGTEPAEDESVASFVSRRLGTEALDYLADPFIAGIYAGDPARLSIRHALPRVYQLAHRHGSLFRGALATLRTRTRTGRTPPMFSFPGGMTELPDALARRLGHRIRLRCPVAGLRFHGEGWHLSLLGPDPDTAAQFDGVIMAVPAYTVASLRWQGVDEAAFEPLQQVRYVPVASLTLGFPEQAATDLPDGFGLLAPSVEGRRILGTVFASALFAGRAPAGHVTLATMVGGTRQPGLALSGADAFRTAVLAELESLLGVKPCPVFEAFGCWPKAIPQYEIGHGRVVAAIEEIERRTPSLAIAGSFRDGPAVSDTLHSGILAAGRVAAALAHPAGVGR